MLMPKGVTSPIGLGPLDNNNASVEPHVCSQVPGTARQESGV